MASKPLFADDAFIPLPGTGVIPLGDIIPWGIFGALLAMIFLYFVSTEQGALSK